MAEFDFTASMCERETHKHRDGEKWGDIISTFQTGGSLDQNSETGTLGGIFQSQKHGNRYFSKQKMNTEL